MYRLDKSEWVETERQSIKDVVCLLLRDASVGTSDLNFIAYHQIVSIFGESCKCFNGERFVRISNAR